MNHIDSVISHSISGDPVFLLRVYKIKKEYFKISYTIELFNWNYRRLKMVNNGYLTWHQRRNHGIVLFPFKHTQTHSIAIIIQTFRTIKQKDSGTWCDTLSARLGFLYRFYWKHCQAMPSKYRYMRNESWGSLKTLCAIDWRPMRFETIYVCVSHFSDV